MKAADFVQLAGKLVVSAGMEPREARHRTVVSRAYYGAFHSACELLREWNIPVRRNAYGHQDAIDILRASKHHLAEAIAGDLDDLRSERIRADYRLEVRNYLMPSSAKDCVEQAMAILSALDRCRAVATEIKAAIEKSQTRDT